MAQNENLVLESLKMLPAQITDVWRQAKGLALPRTYKNVNQIVVNGMGGSNLGARILASVFSQDLKLPLIVCPGYEAPKYVNGKTLFILSSYSGNTEETLNAYAAAKKSGAKLLIITAASNHNKLAIAATKDKTPALMFEPAANPSAQPRLALGYSLFALAAVAAKLGVLKLSAADIENAAAKLAHFNQRLVPEKSNNPASVLAHDLAKKIVVIVTGEFLEGNAHALRNQFNENSKNFATYLVLSELNHYAMEGLAKPANLASDVIFLFFDSALYSPRVQTRNRLTKQVVAKNKITSINYVLKGKTKLDQSLEMLALGSWLTYYLADLNNVDPAAIPWVDWFKKELK